MALATPALIGEWTHQSSDWVSANQADLERAAELADERVFRKTGRWFTTQTGVAKTFQVDISTDRMMVGDLLSATMVEFRPRSSGAGWMTIASDDYDLVKLVERWEPFQQIVRVDGRVFPRGQLRIMGNWGWSEPYPAGVVQAAMMIASNYMARRGSPKKVASSFTGQENDLGTFMDVDIEELLMDFRLPDVG